MRLLLLALLVVPSAFAQPFAGSWSGEIQIPGQPLAFSATFTGSDDALTGVLSIPAQNLAGFALSDVRADGDSLFFVMQGIPGTPRFSGAIDSANSNRVAGEFVQGAGRLRFEMTRGDGATVDQAAQRLEGLEAFVDSVRAAYNVPGLAVAVVRADTVLLAFGSGLRDVDGRLPVTTQTQFPIGSSTKAFVSALLGTLADEGMLDWQTPIRRYLSTFEMHDPIASGQMTAVDLLTHRSGLPRHDLMWYGSPLTREQMIERLRYLEPTEPFRSAWQYQNLMFTTAGYLGGELAGSTWEEATRQRLFEPLGMTAAGFSVGAMQGLADFALGYKGGLSATTVMPFRDLDAVGPAGSINANIQEFGRWAQFQLGDGQIDGRRILESSTLKFLHAPEMIVNPNGQRATPYTMYAKGWFVEPLNGRRMLHHGGNIDGFSALVGFLPDDDLGVAILSNQDASALPRGLMLTIFERALGEDDPADWIGQALAVLRGRQDQQTDGARVRIEGTKPAHELADYAGAYVHPAYDTLHIALDRKALTFRRFDLTVEMAHRHFETFLLASSFLEGTSVTFRTNEDGRVDELEVSVEPMLPPVRFERAAPSELSDDRTLGQYAGRYNLRGQTVVVEMASKSLRITVPGQPTYTLVPVDAGYFHIQGLNGFAVRFSSDASALTFEQPNGQFRAERME